VQKTWNVIALCSKQVGGPVVPVIHFLSATSIHIQGNVLFSNELAKRYVDQGIVSVSLNPGKVFIIEDRPGLMSVMFTKGI
jgi:hypothetical protein